uniref:PHD-type domain-containing protein n=1 Tax=Photinus pyralis TaxID=7054 RepID=A0A1Y1L7Z2_PHOPY
MDVEEIDPMDLLSPDLAIDNVDPLSTCPEDEDDNDVEEIIQEPVIIDILDDEPENPPITNGVAHSEEPSLIVFHPGQVPDDYTDEERVVYEKICGPGQQAVQFHRLHCTACNAHLGSAPADQDDRYLHPLMKVLICKSCFDFYGSGDFDRDDDGSELYCRWCGQGGKVLCCAQCAYVFCQRCIRVNLGKKALDMVKASDDWLCFVCNPNQIVKLRVICRALYDYVQEELKRCKDRSQAQILSKDKSLCCKTKPVAVKRKENDTTYDPENRKKKKLRINSVSTTPKEPVTNTSSTWVETHEDEVVCTPDISMLMDEEESHQQPHFTMPDNDPLSDGTPETLPPPMVPLTPVAATDIQFVNQTKSKVAKKTQANRLGYTISPKVMKKVDAKGKANSNVVRKSVAFDKLQYDWFEKATKLTADVNQSLSTKLSTLSKNECTIQSLASLAQMHNDLQAMLSGAINSLMEVRKTLRSDFIASIKKLQFTESIDEAPPAAVLNNNDIIEVDSTVLTEENSPQGSRNYIKVKPTSELLASSVITIPDDATPQEPAPTPQESPTTPRGCPTTPEERPTTPEERPTTPKPSTPSPEREQINCEADEDDQNQTEDLSEIVESLNPETVTQIKRALLESKFEKIVNENLSVNANLPRDDLKKMASVRVVLSPNYVPKTPPLRPSKQYSPPTISESQNQVVISNIDDEEDIENILSASLLLNPAKKVRTADSTDDSDDQNDPLALDPDSSNNDTNISNGAFDEDANLNNDLSNTTEGIAVL